MKTDAKKRAAHAAVRSRIHGVVKKAVAAATTDQKEIALREAQSVIDTAARKGIIHKNAAARKKSRLNASVNAAIAADGKGEDLCPRLFLLPLFMCRANTRCA